MLPPASFAALARLLRASLDRAATDREFLQARNCVVASGLFAVQADEYAAWLLPLLPPPPPPDSGSGDGAEEIKELGEAAEGGVAGEGGRGGEWGGERGREGAGGHSLAAVVADVELVSATAVAASAVANERDGVLDQRQTAGENTEVSSGGADRGGDGAPATASVGYLLQRELRRHPVWSTVELWEVAMSDSVVMAMAGGGERAERWLPAETMAALDEVRYLL